MNRKALPLTLISLLSLLFFTAPAEASFYDDFATIDPAKWTTYGNGTITAASGILTLTNGTNTDGSLNQTGIRTLAEDFETDDYLISVKWVAGVNRFGLINATDPTNAIFFLSTSSGQIDVAIGDGSTWDNRTVALNVPAGFNTYKIDWTLDYVAIYINSLLLAQSSVVPLTNMRLFFMSAGGSTSQLEVDWLSVASYLDETTVTATATTTSTAVITKNVTSTSTSTANATATSTTTTVRTSTSVTTTTSTSATSTLTASLTKTHTIWGTTSKTTTRTTTKYASTVTGGTTTVLHTTEKTTSIVFPFTYTSVATHTSTTNTTYRRTVKSIINTVTSYTFYGMSAARDPVLAIFVIGTVAASVGLATVYLQSRRGGFRMPGFPKPKGPSFGTKPVPAAPPGASTATEGPPTKRLDLTKERERIIPNANGSPKPQGRSNFKQRLADSLNIGKKG